MRKRVLVPTIPFVLAIVLSGLAAVSAFAAPAPCSSCDAVKFPKAAATLAAQGFPASQYRVLLSWTEALPGHPGQFVTGYHVAPLPYGQPFDLYLGPNGLLKTARQAQQAWGLAPKRWSHLKPLTVLSRPVPPGLPQPPPPPWPAEAKGFRVAPTTVTLPPVDLGRIAAQDAAGLSSPRKGVKRIGVFQTLPETLIVTASTASQGAWQTLSDGSRLFTAVLEAAGAKGQRIHFSRLTLPAGAYVLVYNADHPAERYGPFTGFAPGDHDLWSPTCFSERVGVECRVPAGVDPSGLQVEVDKTVYVYAGFESLPWAKAAGSCELDVSCYPAWATVAKGVGGIGTIGDTGFLWCTGTLIADSDPTSATPYFLTANHCVGSQAEASTLEIYWLYQTPTCGGTPPDPASVPRTTGGADYLAGISASAGSDFTLLRLRSTPPSGLTFVGWSTKAVADGTPVVGIHHPEGDYKRISFGTINQSALSQIGQSPNEFWGVTWNQGVTEPGSSGSPLLDVSSQLILGQLWGGASACDAPSEPDAYGRFDKSYPLMSAYLGPTLHVIRPNGGELWFTGATQTIQWSASPDIASVTIELLRSGSLLRTLANSTANTGAFSWTIPSDLPAATDYTVRISALPSGTPSDTSDGPFTIHVAPSVTSVTPNQGLTAGGEAVTISGSGFSTSGITTVTFGDVAATNVQVADATTIHCTAPAHSQGTVNVTVTGPDGGVGTLTGAYTYTALTPAQMSLSTSIVILSPAVRSSLFAVENLGQEALNWNGTSDNVNVTLQPSSGTNRTDVTVAAMDFTHHYTAHITVTDVNDPADTGTITVEVFPYIVGDVNGDGAVNALDVQAVVNQVLGVSSKTSSGDVNRDGTVNAVDVQLVVDAVLSGQ